MTCFLNITYHLSLLKGLCRAMLCSYTQCVLIKWFLSQSIDFQKWPSFIYFFLVILYVSTYLLGHNNDKFWSRLYDFRILYVFYRRGHSDIIQSSSQSLMVLNACAYLPDDECYCSIDDAGPTVLQRWVSVPCWLGWLAYCCFMALS